MILSHTYEVDIIADFVQCMRIMKLTQKDIAERLNVSASLVSRALTGTAGEIGASKVTIQRIREEAEKLNYSPSTAALALRGKQTRTLGLVVKDFDDPFFGHMVRELQQLARENDYSLLMTGCLSKNELSIDLTPLLKHQLDGLIIAGSDFMPNGIKVIAEKKLPVVQIGTGARYNGVVSISMDQTKGMQQLLAYLGKLGHHEIGYIGDDSEPNLRREKVLAGIMRKAGLGVRRNWFVRVADCGSEAGYTGMKELLRNGRRLPTAVVLADDVFAITALRACYEAGLKIPSDLSLAGVDDIPFARMMIPALTTVRQPIEKMIRTAFEAVVSNSGRKKSMVVEPELVIRESCGPATARKKTVTTRG